MSAQVGDKRAAEDELLREEVVAGEEDGCEDAPFADVKPRIQPSDVHVLLADDEKISRLVTSKLLRMCGYQVTAVESGRALLLRLAETPRAFNLILTDVAMPDVNGLEVLRYVRSQPALHALPVIMMSAHENAGTVFECIQRGAEDYLLKPMTLKVMKQLWQHVWRRRYSWQRIPTLDRHGNEEVLPPSAQPEPQAAQPPEAAMQAIQSGSKEEDAAETELYTAEEMRAHCMRQIARYQRVLHVIDTHPHLFPSAAEPPTEGTVA